MYNEYPERIYVDRGIDASTAALLGKNNSSNDLMSAMAMMNNGMGGFGNGCWWIWILFLLWGRNGWGNNGVAGEGVVNGFQDRLSTLQETIQDNHNSDLLMSAIKGNESAIQELAGTLNCNFNALNTSICTIQSAIKEVGGQIGFSAERVINAVNMGDCAVTNAIKDCCCNTQQSILKMGYENQIATLNQTNALTGQLNTLGTGQERGFSSIAYETQNQTCQLLKAGQDNTQRIVDVLNSHWNAELQQKYNDARLELSQYRQNAYLIEQLKPTTTTA